MPRKDGYPTKEEYEEFYRSGKYKPLVLTDAILSDLYAEILDIVEEIATQYNFTERPLHPSHWSLILTMLSQRIFKPRPELIRKYNLAGKSYKGGFLIFDNIEKIYDIYSTVSDLYTQRKSLYLFCRFTGLDSDRLVFDGNDRETNTKKKLLYEKIKRDDEASIIGLMQGTRDNPVKYIAYLNHKFRWNETTPADPEPEKIALSLDKIPRLELSDNSPALPEPGDDELF